MKRLTTISIALVLTLTFTSDNLRADWPQFRGPNSSGVSVGPAIPADFGPGKNELWSVSVQAGHSSPVISGDSIFLTTFDRQTSQVSVVCLERQTGKTRWQRTVHRGRMEKGHPSFNPASSTPATDGQRVVAYFGSFGLVCFDKAGKKLWDIKMPVTKSFGGNATSPAIVGDRVILYRGNYVDHFLLAVDKQTGKQLWKVKQDEPINGEMACTACPIVAGDKLITHTARSLQAIDIASGKQVWVVKANTTATSTPVLAENDVIVAAWNKMGEPALRPAFPTFEALVSKHDKDGDKLISRDEFPKLWIFHRPDGAEAPMNGGTVRFERVDRNRDREIAAGEWSSQVRDLDKYRARYASHGLLAVPLASKGLVASEKVRTLETQGIPEVPSPLYHDGYIYFVKNGGVVTCLELETGKRIYRMRAKGTGTYYASPIIADGKLFTTSGAGRISVLSLGPKPKTLAANDMGEDVYATPAISDGVLYVRTHKRLFAFGLDK